MLVLAFLHVVVLDSRSDPSQMFFKIGVLKNFANFTENTSVGVFFIINLKAFRCAFAKIVNSFWLKSKK